jgi:hypothetical protein
MQKIEFASADKVRELCQSAAIEKPEERAKLERYLQLRIEGTDSFQVQYNPSGIDGNGRLCVSTGLQSFSRDIRNVIAGKFYHSVSFSNSYKDPIKAHLETKYGATPGNAEPLKQHFRRIFDNLRHHQNFYHQVLFTVERSVLMAMTEFFEAKDWNVDCFIHQTILVRRRDDGNLNRQLFNECENYIYEKTGVKVKVTVNPTL